MAQNFLSDIKLGDDIYIRLGDATNGDLQIYHDGDHSYIQDAGTGELRLAANVFRVLNANASETMIYAEQDGKVQLRFNESTKFETTSAGVTITGALTTTAGTSSIYNRLTISDGTNQINIGQWDGANHRMEFDSNRPTLITSYEGNINLGISGGTTLNITSSGINVTGNLDTPNISINDYVKHNGDTDTYFGFPAANTFSIGTGGTERMRIDSSGNVGIGTAAPAYKVEINDATANGRAIQAVQSATSGTNYGFQGGAYGSGATKNIGLHITAEGATTNVAGVFVGDVEVKQTGDVYLTLESTDASTAEEVAIKYSNQSTGSNYWWAGLNQSANYSLAYGTAYSGANVKMEISTTGDATFAGTLTIPSYIYHTSDPGDDTYFGFSGNDTFVVYTAAGKGIEIDSNRNVDFTGSVGVGVAGGSNAKLEVVSASGEVFRADAASGAFRIVANQTGVSTQGTFSHSGGAGSFSGTLTAGTFKTSGGLTGIVITGQEIYANEDYNGDDGAIRLNRFGYQGGQTKFRDVVIYDGKGAIVAKVDGSDKSTTFEGTITAAGGSANNNDDANILTLNASQHARLLVDTSSTSGHRATLALESNSNELTLATTGSASELNAVGTLSINASNLALNNGAATKTYLLGTDGGSVQLRHNDNTKLETTSAGVTVTGAVTATSFSGDGSNLTGVTSEWDGTLTGNATITGALTVNLSSEGTYFTGGSGGVRQLSITSGTNTSAHALHTFNIASTNGKYEFEINSTPQLTLDSSSATFAGSVNLSGVDVGGVTSPTLYIGQLTNAYQAGMQSNVHLTMKTTNGSGNFYWYRGSSSVMYYSDALYVDKLVDKGSTNYYLDPGSTSTALNIAGHANISNNVVKISTDGTYGGSYGTVGFGGISNGSNRVFGHTGTGDGLFLASATGRGIFFRVNGGSTDNVAFNSDGSATFAGDVLPSADASKNLGSGALRWATLRANYGDFNQSSTTDPVLRLTDAGVANYDFIFPDTNTIKLETNTSSTKTFKLLNAGSGDFNFEASGATFAGNVGFGGTTPNFPVDVHIARNSEWLARFRNTGTAPYGIYVDTSSNASTSYTFAAYTASDDFYIRNDGRVGIGAPSPNNTLEIASGKGIYVLDAAGDLTTGTTLSTNFATNASVYARSFQLYRSMNTNAGFMGVYGFFNTANSSVAQGNSGTEKFIGGMAARVVTSDSNASDDSGGYLEFYTKPEAGDSSVALTLGSENNATFGGDVRITQGAFVASQTSLTNPVLRLTNTDVNDYDFTFPNNSTIQLGSSVGTDLIFKLVNAGAGDFNLDVGGDAAFAGDVTVTGDFQVNGITTTTNVVNLDVSDNIIGLNRGSTSNTNDAGLIIERGSTGDNAAFLWDEGDDAFIFGTTTANPAATGNITYAFAPIKASAGTFAGDVDVTRSSTGQILSRVWNSNTGGNGTAVFRIANSGNQANGARLEFSDANYYNATVSVDRTNGMRFMVHDDSNSMADLLTHPVLTLATNKNATFANNIYLTSSSKVIKADLSSGGTTRTAEIEFYNSSNGAIKYMTTNSSSGGHEFWTQGSKRFEVEKGGDATFAGNVDVDGAGLNVGPGNEVQIVSSGSSLFPSIKLNNNGYIGSASETDAMQFLTNGNTVIKRDLSVGQAASVAEGITLAGTLTNNVAQANASVGNTVTLTKINSNNAYTEYTGFLSWTYSGTGSNPYTFNLVFDAGTLDVAYEVVLRTGRNGNWRNFGAMKDFGYIYNEADGDFKHNAEGDVTIASSLGTARFSLDSDPVGFGAIADNNTSDTASSGVYSKFIRRYSFNFENNTTGSNGEWEIYVKVYNFASDIKFLKA